MNKRPTWDMKPFCRGALPNGMREAEPGSKVDAFKTFDFFQLTKEQQRSDEGRRCYRVLYAPTDDEMGQLEEFGPSGEPNWLRVRAVLITKEISQPIESLTVFDVLAILQSVPQPEMPSDDIIRRSWWRRSRVARELDIDGGTVTKWIQKGKLEGRTINGELYVNPTSVDAAKAAEPSPATRQKPLKPTARTWVCVECDFEVESVQKPDRCPKCPRATQMTLKAR